MNFDEQVPQLWLAQLIYHSIQNFQFVPFDVNFHDIGSQGFTPRDQRVPRPKVDIDQVRLGATGRFGKVTGCANFVGALTKASTYILVGQSDLQWRHVAQTGRRDLQSAEIVWARLEGVDTALRAAQFGKAGCVEANVGSNIPNAITSFDAC